MVDFSKRMAEHTQKREEHTVTYDSGGSNTQVDHNLSRHRTLKDNSDCKVVGGKRRMVVCWMTLMVRKRRRTKGRAEAQVVEVEK